MDKTLDLSWDEIENYCRNLCSKIFEERIKYDVIVGIQRGGVIPGVILSHMLSVPDFYSIGIRTTEKENCRTRVPNAIVKSGMLTNFSNKNVLIVDDVTNTGLTLGIAKKEVERHNPRLIKTAAVIWDGKNSPDCPADIFADYTPGWVTFPWETKIFDQLPILIPTDSQMFIEKDSSSHNI